MTLTSVHVLLGAVGHRAGEGDPPDGGSTAGAGGPTPTVSGVASLLDRRRPGEPCRSAAATGVTQRGARSSAPPAEQRGSCEHARVAENRRGDASRPGRAERVRRAWLDSSPVSDDPCVTDVQARAVARAAPDLARDRRARAALRRRRRADRPGRAARCATRCSAGCSNDLDFTTSAPPEVTERLLEGWADAIWDMGRAFGTIGCRKGDWKVEITTYRSDAYDPTTRKPDVQYGDSLDGDLGRATSPSTRWRCRCPGAQLDDPYGGIADLAQRRAADPRHARGRRSPTTRCG